jgi:hypothetical protein
MMASCPITEARAALFRTSFPPSEALDRPWEKTFQAPETSFQSPEKSFQSPEKSFQSPEKTFQSPEKTFQSPEKSFQSPEKTFQSPEMSFPNPETSFPSPEASSGSCCRAINAPISAVQAPNVPRQIPQTTETGERLPVATTGHSGPRATTPPPPPRASTGATPHAAHAPRTARALCSHAPRRHVARAPQVKAHPPRAIEAPAWRDFDGSSLCRDLWEGTEVGSADSDRVPRCHLPPRLMRRHDLWSERERRNSCRHPSAHHHGSLFASLRDQPRHGQSLG